MVRVERRTERIRNFDFVGEIKSMKTCSKDPGTDSNAEPSERVG